MRHTQRGAGPDPERRNCRRCARRLRYGSLQSPVGDALWYSVAEPVPGEEWTPNARSARQILRLDLVSVLVSIFQPNGVDLVDFRDFRDFSRLV